MNKVFRFYCDFLVKAKDLKSAEDVVKEQFGIDVYESHILCDEVKNRNQEVDIDLTK